MKKSKLFSKAIVIFCIIEITIMQIWAMLIATHTTYEVTGLITANHSVVGGELLLLCLKRILANDSKKVEDERGYNQEVEI